MKKILIVLPLVALIVSCGLKPPDVEGIENLLTKDLEVTVTPEDDSVTIEIAGFPDELPEGLEGVSVYVSDFDMTGLPGGELGTLIASEITSDIITGTGGLENGKQYFVEGRGEVAGDTVSTVGFGGMFYPRPWGSGSYLGYNPDAIPPEEGINNALRFDRTTGYPEEDLTADGEADFFLFTDALGENLYITNTLMLGGEENGVEPAGVLMENWLKVQDSSTTYSDTVMLEKDQVYHFMLVEGYYGKFGVDSIKVVTPPLHILGEGDALKVYLRYAFQTNKHVGHY